MEKTYERINWENYPSVVTPINEKNLNKMDQALDEVDNRVIGLDTAKLDKATANTMVKDVSFDENTGIFTITYLNGTVKKVDTALEKIATNFTYNRDTQKLLLTLVDGTEQEVDLSSLISQYEFTDSDYITFEVGNDGKVKATIKSGSITEDMLQPNFLADVKVEVEKAKTYSNSASNSSNEAKQYRDEAEQFRNEASSFVPEGYDELVQTVEENTVKIDTLLEKAGLEFNNTTKGSNIHLTDSADSNVVALELYGKTEQNAYTGKNLFTFPNIYYNGTGLNITKSTDGTYLLNGTSTGAELRFYDGYNSINKRLVVPNGTYKIVATINGEEITSTSTFVVITNGTTYASHYGTSFEITDGFAISSIAVNLTVGKNYTNSELKIMVCKQSEDNVLEPYVGGKPSPSPSYPQEIKSVKGKNLLDCRGLTEQTVNNVTFTPVYDSNGNLLYINANGTASAGINYEIGNITTTSDVVLNGISNGGSNKYEIRVTGANIHSNYNGDTIISEILTNAKVSIVIRNLISVDNVKFYPMIRPASITDSTYVPYGLLRIKTHGKNFVDMSNPVSITNMSYNDDTKTYVQTATDTSTGFLLYIRQLKAYNVTTDYKWVYDGNIKTAQTISCTFTKLSGYNAISIKHNGQAKDVGIFLDISHLKDGVTYYFKMNIVNATQGSIEFGEIIISETESDYIPYQSTEITLSKPIELNGINGVYDVVTSEGVTRRFAKVVFDGSSDENWKNNYSRNNAYYISITDKLKNGNTLCSHYQVVTIDEFDSCDYCFNNGDNIMIKDKDCDDLSAFKTKLQSNPITILYELATPTTEAMQNDFNALKTFYPETYISKDADCDMSVTYLADAKNYIDNKLALLEMALFNNI